MRKPMTSALHFLAFPWTAGPLAASGGGACTPQADTLCLRSSRFEVTAEWDDGAGGTHAAQVVPVSADTYGFFRYDDPDTAELFVRMGNLCDLNASYYVFAEGVSDLAETLRVFDTVTGTTVTYSASAGTFLNVMDEKALPCSTSEPDPPSVPVAVGDSAPAMASTLFEGRFEI